jgi:hypothetical protein
MSCKNPKSPSVKPSDTGVAASVPKEDADMSACKRGPSKRKWMRGCVFQPIKRYCTASANYHIVFLLAHSH